MGVLESVIKFREMEDQKKRNELSTAVTALNTFQERKRQSILDELTLRKTNAEIANIESQIKDREKGSLLDDIKDAGEIYNVAKAVNDPVMGAAAKKYIRNAMGTNQQTQNGSLLNEEGTLQDPTKTVTTEPTQAPTTKAIAQPGATEEGLPTLEVAERDMFGELTEEGKITDEYNKLRLKRYENDLNAQKELKSQILKDRQKGLQNYSRVQGRVDNIMTEFTNLAARNMDITQMKPGWLSGVYLNTIGQTADQRNEFIKSFQGLKVQVAAASGMISMPGSRGGIRMIQIFKETTIDEYQTMEQAIQTSVVDLKNAFVEVQTQTPWEFLDMNEQEWNNLSFDQKQEYNKILSDKKNEIAEDYKNRFQISAYKANPALFRDETRAKIEAGFPTFETAEEGDKMLPKGTMFRVGRQIMEAE